MAGLILVGVMAFLVIINVIRATFKVLISLVGLGALIWLLMFLINM